MGDSKVWIKFWECLALTLVFLFLTIGISVIYNRQTSYQLISKAIEKNQDPLRIKCALMMGQVFVDPKEVILCATSTNNLNEQNPK